MFFGPNKFTHPIKDGSIQSLPGHKSEAQVDETATTQWEHVGQQPAPSAGPEIQNVPSSAGVPNEPHPADEWIDRPHVLIRKHNTPRLSLFQPGETQDCPIPLSHIDVTRTTTTDTDTADEQEITDEWDGSIEQRSVSQQWTGDTTFDNFFNPPNGFQMSHGRLTKKSNNGPATSHLAGDLD